MHIPYPESPRVLRPASLWRRLLAMLYDGLLVIALWMVLTTAAMAMNQGVPVSKPVLQTLLFIATYLFFAFFWTRSGQTLGMLAWNLRVQSTAGGHISWTQSLIRYLVAVPSAALCGLGYAWMLIGDEKLTWGDRLSDTRVVQLEKKKKAAG